MSQRAVGVSLHGGYFDNNFGDLLLLQVFERWLREQPGIDGRARYPLVPRHEVERFQGHLPGARTGRRQLLAAKGLVYAGGGHFGEPGAASSHAYGDAWSERFLQRHVLPARLARALRRRWLIAGVGAGPLTSPRVRDAARRLFDDAWGISVRDVHSRDFLVEDLGVERIPEVYPDPVLSLQDKDIPDAARQQAGDTLVGLDGTPRLGIHHPRDWLLDSPGATMLRDTLIERLARHGDTQLVIFSDNANGEAALQLIERLPADLRARSRAAPFDGVWHTVALIGELDAVLTTKLHVGIVAFALGRHASAFAIHPKVPRLYEQIEHPERCCLLDTVHRDQAVAMIDDAIEAANRSAARRNDSPSVTSASAPDGVEASADASQRETLRQAALQNRRLLHEYCRSLLGDEYPSGE